MISHAELFNVDTLPALILLSWRLDNLLHQQI
jgi:hypothetical protein